MGAAFFVNTLIAQTTFYQSAMSTHTNIPTSTNKQTRRKKNPNPTLPQKEEFIPIRDITFARFVIMTQTLFISLRHTHMCVFFPNIFMTPWVRQMVVHRVL